MWGIIGLVGGVFVGGFILGVVAADQQNQQQRAQLYDIVKQNRQIYKNYIENSKLNGTN